VRSDEPLRTRPRPRRRSCGSSDRRRQRGRRRSAIAAAVAGVALVGGSIAGWTRPVPVGIGIEAANEGAWPSLPRDRPIHIEIPSIGVSAPIVPLGLNADGTLAVPSKFRDAGWYLGAPFPARPARQSSWTSRLPTWARGLLSASVAHPGLASEGAARRRLPAGVRRRARQRVLESSLPDDARLRRNEHAISSPDHVRWIF